MKNRIESIDVARGLAMLLVIIQHNCGFSQLILSFHMPLFFMVSGLVLTREQPKFSFWFEMKRNARRLLIPQVMLGGFECVFIFISTLFYEHKIATLGVGIILQSVLRWWFLLVLFQARLLIWLVKKYIFGSRLKECALVLFLTVLSIIIYLLPGHLDFLPLYMNLVPICLLFILIGYYAKRYLHSEVRMKDSIVMLFLLVITIVVAQSNSQVYMYSYDFGNFFLFIVTSLSGSFFFIRLATVIKSNYIKWIGVMCMPIYVLQFHVNQYSRAIEATILDYLGCDDVVIKITITIAISLIVCTLLTNWISKFKTSRLLFGLS